MCVNECPEMKAGCRVEPVSEWSYLSMLLEVAAKAVGGLVELFGSAFHHVFHGVEI